jgi:hypothetical protein
MVKIMGWVPPYRKGDILIFDAANNIIYANPDIMKTPQEIIPIPYLK